MLPSKSNREPPGGVHTISGSPAPGFCPREPATQHPLPQTCGCQRVQCPQRQPFTDAAQL